MTRRNSWNDLYYRDDPTILGWELANEPHMPGDDTGDIMQVDCRAYPQNPSYQSTCQETTPASSRC